MATGKNIRVHVGAPFMATANNTTPKHPLRNPKPMQYEDLYRRIGQIIFSCGPEGARELIVQAELFADDDGGQFQFDYIDEHGEPDWFEPDARAIGDLSEALRDFQQFFVDNNMTNGLPVWQKCVVTLNVPEEAISIDVQYD
jgi:hypothetical protein